MAEWRFSEVARDRAPLWCRIAFLVCGDWALAEDIVQVALVRLYQRWDRLDPAGVDAYTRKVIARLAIDESRRPHRRAEVLVAPPDRPGPTPPADRDEVRAALGTLGARQRAVLVLRFSCDLSVAETASTLRITQGTVKSQSARALGTLRTLLSDNADQDHAADQDRAAGQHQAADRDQDKKVLR
ncbi:sigma-70 family RNA polymerase sigma factor [Actinokineospora terrae]|uniref:RNA polymerase sigma-70 factor, sigma-E family n=1 Tax=Actinokineospora terrae TaxID=155974 RepID=A0A1H9X973_9PSEU|nr:sigma-70 family RNA polymerase sigma factor [Actinokineospora terrae]SES42738.1 RNA polymerase sigma-70 factor, sigma-E family [Actinokineospora terrae]